MLNQEQKADNQEVETEEYNVKLAPEDEEERPNNLNEETEYTDAEISAKPPPQIKKPKPRTKKQQYQTKNATKKRISYKAEANRLERMLKDKENEMYELRKTTEAYYAQQEKLQKLEEKIRLKEIAEEERLRGIASERAVKFESKFLNAGKPGPNKIRRVSGIGPRRI